MKTIFTVLSSLTALLVSCKQEQPSAAEIIREAERRGLLVREDPEAAQEATDALVSLLRKDHTGQGDFEYRELQVLDTPRQITLVLYRTDLRSAQTQQAVKTILQQHPLDAIQLAEEKLIQKERGPRLVYSGVKYHLAND
ncbi:hypothetical protein SAMN02745181_0316 [Rubritalea squalenifaciens DSM 18772]|uniref:Lipoprotein n=1 Tax=Rubritalea squalenifaciens DSM 18772 TaxID=1123071 RepID=A0A1M6BUY3_9BACT|nr:hypothetical protein [Rubritalea squalenifaciens]SHI52565.1 hypothetical protein SAMN02745181_0316 [Rubritalea squalenifaciens DSM 18772]